MFEDFANAFSDRDRCFDLAETSKVPFGSSKPVTVLSYWLEKIDKFMESPTDSSGKVAGTTCKKPSGKLGDSKSEDPLRILQDQRNGDLFWDGNPEHTTLESLLEVAEYTGAIPRVRKLDECEKSWCILERRLL